LFLIIAPLSRKVFTDYMASIPCILSLNDSLPISAKTRNVFRTYYRLCILCDNLLNSGNIFCLISHCSGHIIDCFPSTGAVILHILIMFNMRSSLFIA